jgi:hypothetical protein
MASSFNFSSDKDQVIFLEQTPRLKAENIVVSFIAKINGSKKASGGFIELQLINRYKGKTIVSDIYPDSWTKTISKFKSRAQEKGISKEHIDMITDVLDNNAGKLIKQISDEQEEAEIQAATTKDFAIASALEMVRSKIVELFLDQVKKPYIAIKEEDYTRTMPIQSKTFEDWITATYYFESKQEANTPHNNSNDSDGENNNNKTKFDGSSNAHRIDHSKFEDHHHHIMPTIPKVLGNDEVSKVQTILRFEAEKAANVKTLYVRVASFVDTSPLADLDANVIFIDLCNPKWEIIKITRHGWSVERNYPQVIFKRYSSMNEQILPKKDYPPDILDRFMHLTNVHNDEDNELLAKVYMITLFLLANLPKPIMLPHGTYGSGKSTFQEFVKRVVDPDAALTSAFPSTLPELVMQLEHSYLTFFDNVSEIKSLTSDALCRAVTGSGFKKRALYEDDEEYVYNMKRAIGFNGINVTATRPDLLERILNLELKPIDKRKRRKIEHLQSEFDLILPQLLGFICDTLVKVLSRIGEVKLEELPRMADFAEMSELVSRCLGYPEGKFTETYNRNIGFTNEEAIESSPVATAVIEMMNHNPVWTGKADGLKVALSDVIESKRELASMVYTKNWPKSPRALRDRLNEIEPNLKEIGIVISYKEDKHTKSSTITIVNNNYITRDQTFWEAWEELETAERENPNNMTADDKTTISGRLLRDALVKTGKFDDADEAQQKIAEMVKAGSIREVMQDTFTFRRPTT